MTFLVVTLFCETHRTKDQLTIRVANVKCMEKTHALWISRNGFVLIHQFPVQAPAPMLNMIVTQRVKRVAPFKSSMPVGSEKLAHGLKNLAKTSRKPGEVAPHKL